MCSISSCPAESLSVEKGVLSSRTGLWSKCLEMRLRRETALDGARAARVAG